MKVRKWVEAVKVEWKMGTGSEPPQKHNLLKNAAGSVPVPFFHGGSVSPPEKGDIFRLPFYRP